MQKHTVWDSGNLDIRSSSRCREVQYFPRKTSLKMCLNSQVVAWIIMRFLLFFFLNLYFQIFDFQRKLRFTHNCDLRSQLRIFYFREFFYLPKISISDQNFQNYARPHRKAFGLFYPLETCFSAESFHP